MAGCYPYCKVLVGYDGSEPATKALKRALTMAKSQGAVVTVLSIDEAVPRYAKGVGEIREEPQYECAFCNEMAAQAQKLAQEEGVTIATRCAQGHAADTMIKMAKDEGVDLIAIGHTARSGLAGMLLGSTATKVAEQAGCDVLIVR